jgi:sialate O-acetylesterase
MLLLTFVWVVAGELHLPDQIGNHMVLQQDTQVRLWGETKQKNVQVSVSTSWTSETFSTMTNVNGSFNILIRTPKASFTAHTVTIAAPDATVTLEDVLIGEVFVASGQSNMEGVLAGFKHCPLLGANHAIATCANHPGIRFATQPKQDIWEPVEYAPGPWQVPHPSNCSGWSATAFFFALTLQETLNVPVGILVSAWSGSRIENWMPREILEEMGEKVDGSMVHGFCGQIWPIRKYTIRGFIWYQGESNVGWYDRYAARMARMVEHWRRIWGLGPIPFYYVEIAPFNYGGAGFAGPLLREAQFNAQFMIPNSGIVGTNDIVSPLEYNQIHPANKKLVGERLAYMALNRIYGYTTVVADAPIYAGFEVKDGHVHVKIGRDDGGLGPWADIKGFEVANASGVFVAASAVRSNDAGEYSTIDVWAPEISNPVAVRYCFRDFLLGNVQNNRELPLFPFRSDSWPISAESDELDWEALTQETIKRL